MDAEDISPEVFISFAVASGLTFLLGVVLNALVIATFLRYRSLFSEENILVFSITVSDLLCCTGAVPTSMVSNWKQKWVYGESGCSLHAFLVTLTGLVSITHFAALARKRYEGLRLHGRKFLPDERIMYVVIGLWIYSFLFAIAPVIGWSRYVKEAIGTSCSVDWQSTDAGSVSYTIVIFTGCFFIPVAIIIHSYVSFYLLLRQITSAANATWGSMSTQARESAKTEAKMTALIFSMTAVFLVSWTPYAIVSMIAALGKADLISPSVTTVKIYLAKSSTLYNPIIYFIVYARFRRKLRKLLTSLCSGLNTVHPDQ